jgi:hypothetical protein
MDLEHRVKTLEHEVKILKNQIQRTLLEIQEQVLTHYHPGLRTEEIVIPESVELPPGSTRNGSAASSPTEEMLPRVRKVSFDDVIGQQNGSAPIEEAAPLPPAVKGAGDDHFSELAYWVGDSLMEIGAERTGKLIEIRTKRGRLDDNVKEALLQLVQLCDDGSGRTPDEAHVRETIGAFLKLNSLLG